MKAPLLPEIKHRQTIQSRFNDYDMFGHVNNQSYLKYCDLAKIEYFRAIIGDNFELADLALVIVHIECDFFNQTFLDENVEVFTRATSVGKHSMHLEQWIAGCGNGEVKMVARSVMAAFDPKTHKGAEMKPEWIAGLEKYEGREFPITHS